VHTGLNRGQKVFKNPTFKKDSKKIKKKSKFHKKSKSKIKIKNKYFLFKLNTESTMIG
jgi:hypothetical protein